MSEPLSAYKSLKPVERLFVDAYLSELENSAVRAGQRVIDMVRETGAGNAEDHYYARTRVAHFHADRMMAKPLVQAAIAERVRELTEALDIGAVTVLREVAHIARSSVGHFWDGYDEFDGTPIVRFDKATPEQIATIASFKVEEKTDMYGRTTRKIEYKMHDKLGALDKLMRYMGLFEEGASKSITSNGQPVPSIPHDATTEQAGDLYARTLTG